MKDKSCISLSWCLAYIKQIAGHQNSVYWVTVFYGRKCTATIVSFFTEIKEKHASPNFWIFHTQIFLLFFSILLREGGQRKAFNRTPISCALNQWRKDRGEVIKDSWNLSNFKNWTDRSKSRYFSVWSADPLQTLHAALTFLRVSLWLCKQWSQEWK